MRLTVAILIVAACAARADAAKPVLKVYYHADNEACRQMLYDLRHDEPLQKALYAKYAVQWIASPLQQGLPTLLVCRSFSCRRTTGYRSKETFAQWLGLDWTAKPPPKQKVQPQVADSATRIAALEKKADDLAANQEKLRALALALPIKKWNAYDGALADVVKRLQAIERQPVPVPVDVAPLQKRLQALEERPAIRAAPAKPSSPINPTATSIITWLGTAAGLSAAGATGAGIAIPIAFWLYRRRKRRKAAKRNAQQTGDETASVLSELRQHLAHFRTIVEKPVPVATDSPPLPGQVVTENHYVPFEKDTYREAHEWASKEFVRKYPGAVGNVEAIKSLIDQYLSSQGKGQ